jgi:cytochrome P450
VSSAFTPSRVRALAPRIEALTGEMLSGALGDAASGGRFDLIGRVALPLPVAWSAALGRSLDPAFLIPGEERERQRAAREAFAGYLRGLLPARQRSPGDDLISGLLGAYDDDGRLTEDELIGLCMLLLIAGHETTKSLIGAGVLALVSHPGELSLLQARPARAGQAVEELLRYDPPVQMIARFARTSAEISGVTFPAGSFTLLLLGAANRDPALCAEPGRFSVERGVRRHLAFGHGIHFCLGAPLARLEAAIALRRMLPLLPRPRVAAEPEWKPNTVLRGLEYLWLEPAP